MIIDTMVMAYAVLDSAEFGRESIAFLREADAVIAPASVEAELLSVVWQWRLRDVSREAAESAYFMASRLWDELIPVETLWPLALELAFAKNHSPYDTLFVAAARVKKTRVATYDKKLLAAFPDDTVSPGSL